MMKTREDDEEEEDEEADEDEQDEGGQGVGDSGRYWRWRVTERGAGRRSSTRRMAAGRSLPRSQHLTDMSLCTSHALAHLR